MRRWVIISLMLILALTPALASCRLPATHSSAVTTQVPASEQGANGACGRERWPVKTMSDPQAAQVDLTPVDTTVPDLTSLRAPNTLPEDGRVVPTEFTTYRLTARLVKAKIEADQDIHLVIADPKNSRDTMIVELPNPACAGAATSRVLQQMTTARQAFVGRFGTPPTTRFQRISGTAQITGIALFDFLHGQSGVAPNGIEIHPVIEFRLLGGG